MWLVIFQKKLLGILSMQMKLNGKRFHLHMWSTQKVTMHTYFIPHTTYLVRNKLKHEAMHPVPGSNRNAITESVVFLLVPICHMLNCSSLGPCQTLNNGRIHPKSHFKLKVTTH